MPRKHTAARRAKWVAPRKKTARNVCSLPVLELLYNPCFSCFINSNIHFHFSPALKANSICYAFYESNPAGGVNRKNDCPKGYKCASNSNMMSFNTVMRCVKASVSGGSSTTIPQDCTSWYDGCNTCFVRSGKILGCTRRACFRKGKAYCRQHAAKQQYNDVMHYEK